MRPAPGVHAVTRSTWASAADSTGPFAPDNETVSPETTAAGRHLTEAVVGPGLAVAPGANDLTRKQSAKPLGALCGHAVSRDRPGDDVGGNEGTRCGMPTEFEGEQGQVRERAPRDAAPAVLFAHEQRGPPELGALGPVVRGESLWVVAQSSQLGRWHSIRQVLPRRLDEEFLLRGDLQLHEYSPFCHLEGPEAARPLVGALRNFIEAWPGQAGRAGRRPSHVQPVRHLTGCQLCDRQPPARCGPTPSQRADPPERRGQGPRSGRSGTIGCLRHVFSRSSRQGRP